MERVIARSEILGNSETQVQLIDTGNELVAEYWFRTGHSIGGEMGLGSRLSCCGSRPRIRTPKPRGDG